jgi:hypothetical protein
MKKIVNSSYGLGITMLLVVTVVSVVLNICIK